MSDDSVSRKRQLEKVLQIRIEPELMERLDRLAGRKRHARSQVVRDLLREGLDREDRRLDARE